MSDPAPSREDTVKANIAAIESAYTKDAYLQMITQCVKDISVSLALLVDNSTTTTGT